MVDSRTSFSQYLAVRLLGDDCQDGENEWFLEPRCPVDIGRSSKCEVRLLDLTVSRRHATLRHDERWYCHCVGRNGVFHDGRRVDNIPIVDGMVLRLGSRGIRLHFQHVDEVPKESGNLDDSVIEWIQEIAQGSSAAVNDLWREYFDRVVRFARARISTQQRRVSDEEDVAVSVLQSVCAGIEAGRFPDLTSHDSMWRLLCVITKRKVTRDAIRQRRQKRGDGLVRGESVFVRGDRADSAAIGLDQVGAEDDADRLGVELAEQTEWLFKLLGDDELCRITELRLAEYSNEQIAEELGCHPRTVTRRLQTIRSIVASAIAQD